jgi:hypothetical protein
MTTPWLTSGRRLRWGPVPALPYGRKGLFGAYDGMTLLWLSFPRRREGETERRVGPPSKLSVACRRLIGSAANNKLPRLSAGAAARSPSSPKGFKKVKSPRLRPGYENCCQICELAEHPDPDPRLEITDTSSNQGKAPWVIYEAGPAHRTLLYQIVLRIADREERFF